MALNVKQLFELCTDLGLKNDPRGEKEAKFEMEETVKKYKKMEKDEKKYFDEDRLTNPYADSRVHVDNGKTVKKAFMGIDCGGVELLLAKQMGVDTVIGHHPEGRALLDLARVMHLQVDALAKAGVPENLADKSLRGREDELDKALNGINVFQPVDIAKLLGVNYLNVHTPADNCVNTFVGKHFAKKGKMRTLDEVVKAVLEIEEFSEGKKRGDGPVIFVGSGSSRPGKIHVDLTGGTSPAADIYEKMAQGGIGTLLQMHMSKEAQEKCQKYGINVVCVGHIPADSVGLNILADAIEKKGVEIIPLSGFIRVKRK